MSKIKVGKLKVNKIRVNKSKRRERNKDREYCDMLKHDPICKKHINSEILDKISRHQSFFQINMKMGVVGGKEFWEDLIKTKDDWRVQYHPFTNHCRIIDWKKTRQAWGSVKEIICPILDYCRRQEQLEQLAEKEYAIVFCGGGGKGAYQIGVWKWLHEAGIAQKITGVSGASVGALNSLLFVDGDIEKAEKTWLRIQQKDFTYKRKGKVRFSQKRLREIAEDAVDWEGICQTEKIVYSALTATKVPIPAAASVQTVKKGVVKISPTTTIEYPCWAFRPKEEIKRIVLASAAVPVYFKTHYFEGKYYVDGGVEDNIPVRRLVEDGYKKIIIIHLRQKGHKQSMALKKALTKLNTKGVELYEVYPSEYLGDMMKVNQELTKERMNLGYRDAGEQLADLLQ